MSRCVLHVGMYKTGTTSIQQSLRNFEDERFVYANYGGHPNHTRALFALLGLDHPESPAPGGRETAKALARFRQCMAAARGRTLVLSGEGIVALPPAPLVRLREILHERFDEIAVIAAVREPVGFMTSAFQQRVKRQHRDHIQMLKYRSYRNTFRKFDDVFGRQNVTLWKFDPATYPGGCAVRDFCTRLGIALPESRIVRLNSSISREALGLLFIYRKLGRAFGSTTMRGGQNFRLEQALLPIGRTRVRFHPDALQPVLGKNLEDIEWMEARLGQSLRDELGAPRPGDIRDESDLLVPDPGAVDELLAQLGKAAPRGNRGESPEDVVRLVHALRLKCASPLDRMPLGRLARQLLGYARVALGGQHRDPY